MAMCAPTARTTAPTLSNAEQVKFEQTLNERPLPSVGGEAELVGDGCGPKLLASAAARASCV